MSPHTMPRNADPARIQLLKLGEQRLRQLLRDIAVHLISLTPRLPRRIDVEARAGPEIVAFVFAFDLQAPCHPHTRTHN